jgi:hypothetical protein
VNLESGKESKSKDPTDGLEKDGMSPPTRDLEPLPRRLPARQDIPADTSVPMECEPAVEKKSSSNTPIDGEFKAQPHKVVFDKLRTRLRADTATVACEAIAKAGPILRNAHDGLVKVKRVAAAVVGIAIESKVSNASLHLAIQRPSTW